MPPIQLLLLGGIAMVVAAGVGFVAGMLYGRSEFDRVLGRAQKSLSSLVDLLLVSLDRAQRVGSTLEKVRDQSLAVDQIEKVERGRGRLLATLSNLVRSLAPAREAPPTRTPKPVKFEITWQREPACDRTELPSRAAFETNLANLLEASAKSAKSFGVMFISIDKLDHLRSRFGAVATDAFLTTTGRMALHGVRDEDLVCRYNADTFAVLLPEVNAAAADEVARTVRDTLKHHRFHVEATGPEVLVTTSIGLAMCHPGENLPLLLGRVGEALQASRRRGRNQAHVHDGQSMSRCTSA